ncbi:MAG: hypothetical protein DMD54_01940 [Gemmatimonadetes bacterium]|nr:MAG: hypothetical protein DMD54_01940 [Gemmatimonadota bacterium]
MGRTVKRIALGLLAAFAVALLAVYLASLRASPLVNELLRDWATSEIATQSDSVYALHVGRLHFNWPLRRVRLDSALIVTDSARNARRSWPKATVQGVLRSCVISGINLPRLVLGRGLEASQIGCAEVHWESDAPPDSASVARLQQARPPAPRPQPAPDTSRRTESPHGAVMAFQRDLNLPRRVPTIRIGRIVFPKVAIGVVARKPSGDHTRFDLARARLRVTGVVIDPAAPQYRARPLFADGVVLQADSTEFRPDTAQMVRVGALEIDLTDSTITVHDFEEGPRISDVEFQRLSPYRRERIRVKAARLAIRGMDQGGYSQAGAMVARAIELDSLRFEILSDKRKPGRPGPSVPSRTPQSWFSALQNRVAVDTIRATNAAIIYEEFKTGHDRPGRLTIDDVYLLALNVRHEPRRRNDSDTVSLEIRGKLMHQGELRLAITTPLDAERMTMRVRGSVAAMDAQAFNPLIEHVTPARIKSGRIDGVVFEYTVRNDVARGVVVPRYSNLAADLTGTGSGGILGSRNPIGGLLRATAEAAQGLKVRQNNPEEPDRPPRIGRVNHTFRGESLPSWFWNVLKQGLLSVVLK